MKHKNRTHSLHSKLPPGNQTAAMTGNSRLKSLFDAADMQICIDEKRKTETLNLLSQEAEFIRNRPLRDKRRILLNLIRYIDRNPSLTHLAGCIAMFLLLLIMSTREVSTEMIIFAAMMLPSLLACLSAFEIRQVCFVKIAELSKTCFFHVKQLAILSMTLSGLMNLLAISAGILFAGLRWKMEFLHIGLYMLVPFIFMQCICFALMLTEAGRKYSWLSAAFSLPVTLFCIIVAQNQVLYTESTLLLWVIALLTGIALLSAETKIFFSKLGKGDILCTNWN